jgi:HPt (histidine-containing phosphotransfer) domain-containing protein
MANEDKVIDIEDALQRVDGDKDLYFELIDLFFADYQGNVGQLKAHLKAGDVKKFKEVIHMMKGVLGNISAQKAYHQATKMDVQVKAGSLAGMDSEIPKLEAFVAEFKIAAAQYKATGTLS